MDNSYVPFDAEEVRAAARDLVIGSDLRYFASVDSTNRVARDLAPGTWRHGTVIVADYQEAGRGRLQRSWVAPPGSSLLLSMLLAPPAEIAPFDIVMVAALAASDTIRQVTQACGGVTQACGGVTQACGGVPGLEAGLKWPNDVLLGGQKVGGILAERSEQEGQSRAILGIGLNLNFDPRDFTDIPEASTSLQAALGHRVKREVVALALFKCCELWYGYLTQDPNSVFSAWAARLQTVGNAVLVSGTDQRWQGVATGVQRDGALLVRDDKGETHAVYAADVSIRGLGGFTSG